MSWASISSNQCISCNNLQDAVDTSVFVLKNTIPVSTKQITTSEAENYVYIVPITGKTSNQLPVKSNLTAATAIMFDACTSTYADGSGTLLVYVNAIRISDSTPIAVDTEVTISVRIEGGETGLHTSDFIINSGDSCTQDYMIGFNSSEPITTGDVLDVTPDSSSAQVYYAGTVTISGGGCISCF